MIRNYLIIAWRNLLRNKFISLINIGGLAIGISTFMIIIIYLSYELSYDDLVPNKDNIFRVTKHWLSPYNTTGKPDIADAITKSALADLSGINKIGRLYHHPSASIPSTMVSFYDDLAGRKYSFEEFDIYKAEQEVLDIFQLPFVYGNPESALSEMYTAIISESIAIKYFGECSNDIIGKTLFISQDEDIYEENFTITGIFKDLPNNSHLKFDILISYETYSIIDPKRYEEGTAHAWFHCYLELNSQTNPKQLEEQIQLTMDSLYAIVRNLRFEEYTDENYNSYQKMSLQSLSSINLDSSNTSEMKEHSNKSYLLILSGIAICILIIGWINYVNLSLVQVLRRTKETGIRKVIGARRISIIGQFLIESLNANIIALLLSITIISLAIPMLSEFSEKPLRMIVWFDGKPNNILFIVIISLVFLLSTLVTGLYPSIVYSSVSPTSILKGKLSNRSGGDSLRASLIFMQYGTVYILLAVTIGFYHQINYLQNIDLGFDGNQILTVRTPMRNELDFDKIDYLKDQLDANNFIEQSSLSSSVPGRQIFWLNWLRSIHQDSIKSGAIYISADENYLDLYGIRLIAGRDFEENSQNDKNAIIIEKQMLRFLGFENPEAILGEELGIGSNRSKDPFRVRRVIGVIDDYHHTSPKAIDFPIAIIQEGGYLTKVENGKRVVKKSFREYDNSYLSLKLNSTNIRQNIKQIENTWKDVFPSYAFDYFFQDDMYNKQYKADLKFGTIFLLFTIISISLACMGFLGICLFLINQRTKEIGIRKILGASIANLFGLMIYRFMGLILVAGIFGIPVTWYILNRMLQEFAHRIDLSWWLFAAPLAFILIIALLTIGGNTLRKVNANPVEALRYE